MFPAMLAPRLTYLMAVALASWLFLSPTKAAGAPLQPPGDAHEDRERDDAEIDEADEAAEALRAEAAATLARGEFERARREFEKVLRLLPMDPQAQRDAARAAQAAGEFEYSVKALERAHHFDHHGPDPELHYLRGEALYVLEREEEARREHRIAELEIGVNPDDRLKKLWLGRIYARRGQLYRADEVYESLWPPAPKLDEEVALNHADAHLMHQDWAGGEEVLERMLARNPDHLRARKMLAWALEAQGKVDEELPVRASIARDEPTAQNERDWGRALERVSDFRGAHARYEAARQASGGGADETLALSIVRMKNRITPEVAGGLSGRRDPLAQSLREQVGIAVPFGPRHNVSLLAWREDAQSLLDRPGTLPSDTGAVTGIAPSVLLAARGGSSLLLGAELRYLNTIRRGIEQNAWRGGGFGEGVLSISKNAEINVRGDYNTQWNDSAVTISEGGTMTGVTSHLYLFPRDRSVLFDAGAQFRRLSLLSPAGSAGAAAQQGLFFGGMDVVLWKSPARLLRAESLDTSLVRRTYLNDAGILSYRHYQLFGESSPAFLSRLNLAQRAAIHSGTANLRKVFAGRVGVDARGGIGYDTARTLFLYSAGGSLMVAPSSSWSSRLMVSYDFAKESAVGFEGSRHTGWVTYHADL